MLKAEAIGILAFQPREDPLIVGLIERGFTVTEPDVDSDYEMVFLTKSGRLAATLIRESRN